MIGANGLTLDPQGRLIIATYGGRSLVRIEKNGRRTVLADRFEGKRFGGPNDVVVKRDGTIYFTDGNGALRLGAKDPRRELESGGVFMWKDGKVTRAVTDMPTVNGLAFSPDEKYLYVNGSVAKYVNRYEVRPDGTLANGRLFIDISKEPGDGITDGLRVDTKGESLPDCSRRRRLDHRAGRQASRHDSRARDIRQCGIRRRRQEDPLHHGAHGSLQDQGEHARHLKDREDVTAAEAE
jgi:sugar lactone lactonase YvrE